MSSKHWRTVSAWSKAGIGTSVVLELKSPPSSSSSSSSSSGGDATNPSTAKSTGAGQRVVFDIGATPSIDDAIPARYVFLSHGHVDHVGALFGHARAHAVTYGGAAATYFVPAPLLPQIERCRDAMSALDASTLNPPTNDEVVTGGGSSRARKSLIKMKLVPVNAGDEIPLKGMKYGSKTSFFVRAFDVDHAGHPALGYVIGSRTTVGLREEYRNLDSNRIRDLVRSGTSVMGDPIERIEVGYTGDTCARGLTKRRQDNIEDDFADANAMIDGVGVGGSGKMPFHIGQLFRAELLFCELTYLDSADDEKTRVVASERGHMHINNLEGIFASHDEHRERGGSSDRVEYPTTMVFYHLSAKYQPARRALDLISEGLPRRLSRDRCLVAITSMLTRGKEMPNDSIAELIRPCGCISLAEYLRWRDALHPDGSI